MEAALTAAKAQRHAGEVYLEDAELQRSYNVVTAPVAGRVGKRNAEVGNRVQAGQALFAPNTNQLGSARQIQFTARITAF